MSNEKYALSPAAVEAINNMSGAYSAPFWDGILEVSGTLDTVRKIKSALEALYSTGQIIEAYSLILAIYDVIAIETPASVIELEPYPEAIKEFLRSFLLDISDLMNDYEYEDRADNQ